MDGRDREREEVGESSKKVGSATMLLRRVYDDTRAPCKIPHAGCRKEAARHGGCLARVPKLHWVYVYVMYDTLHIT